MKLEDAFLYLVVNIEEATPSELPDICGAGISGGVDIIEIRNARYEDHVGLLEEAARVCRRDGAIMVIGDDYELGGRLSVDGVRMQAEGSTIGLMRVCLPDDYIIGLSSHSLDESILALELGADYLVHYGGVVSPSIFARLPIGAGTPLFAGNVSNLEIAREIVNAGIYRLCVDSGPVDARTIGERMAEFSRLLGRSI